YFAPDAAISGKLTLLVAYRLAADVEIVFAAIEAHPPHFEIAKRQTPIEHGAMRLPRRLVGRDVRQLPARLAHQPFARHAGAMRGPEGVLRHAMRGAGLPIEVRRQLRQRAKSRFAFA